MAFTAAQVAKVMYHLTYPAASWAKTTIETALARVTSLGTDIEDQVIAIIDELDDLNTDIATYSTTDAGVQVKTDGQVYFPTLAMGEKKSRYRLLRTQLLQITQLSDLSPEGNAIRRG